MTTSGAKALAAAIKQHYIKHKRALPWRNTKKPYHIWVSEVILQQTRVEQGTPYYIRFITSFTDVKALAKAEEDGVLKIWQGLGYYSRARNMHAAAKQVATEFGGQFPTKYADLLKLKGVGPYTAAAIASICADEPVAAIDGNVLRVLSRLFNETTPIDCGPGKKRYQILAEKLLDVNDPGDHNQAMMEFGATVCTPKKPLCMECPVQEDCLALRNGTVDALPAKTKKLKKRTRHFHYFHIGSNNAVYMRKRIEKDIWQNMYELPMLECSEAIPPEDAFAIFLRGEGFSAKKSTLLSTHGPIRHLLTHQTLLIHFHQLTYTGQVKHTDWKHYTIEETEGLAKPIPIVQHLERFK